MQTNILYAVLECIPFEGCNVALVTDDKEKAQEVYDDLRQDTGMYTVFQEWKDGNVLRWKNYNYQFMTELTGENE